MTYYTFNPLTQKAKGVAFLARGYSTMTNFSTVKPPEDIVFLALDATSAPIKFPCFARPCPMRPRHGFVESRVVHNFDELMHVWQAARAADADAEIILMPVYTGRLSAVAHSAGVSWGKNHDGATAGNGALNIPCPGSREEWQRFTVGTESIGIVNESWAELVENNYDLIAVQLRDGPKMETHADFVPVGSIGKGVSRIVAVKDLDVSESHPDALLHWEKYIASLADVPYVVIALPEKTLASHFAVHGIVAGIPVICSESGIASLRIGSPLEGVSSAAPLGFGDLKTIATHSNELKAFQSNLSIGWIFEALGTLHASSIWDSQPHLLHLRANMPVVLIRFLAAAALGELRHFSDSFRSGFSDIDFSRVWARDSVYEKAFSASWETLSPALKYCASNKGFARDASRGPSYGGPKWARISRVALRLHCQTELFCRRPSKARWNQVIKTCNLAVNLAHNGGNVLTKWLSNGHLDRIACNPSIGFMSIVAGEHCLQLPNERNENDEEK